MLKMLRVKNFALMEELELNFETGLTVITGETGAGKSMIVEAIAALCGEKIEDISIRTGKQFAEITGIFEPTREVVKMLKDSGIMADDEIIIRRKLEKGKKQVSYINDQLISQNRLKDISRGIIDLVGQYENQSLFQPQVHLELLDQFAGIDNQKTEYRRNYTDYRQLQAKLAELLESAKHKQERFEILKYESDEIAKAQLKPEEENDLILQKNLLLTSEKRSSLVNEIIITMYESEKNIYGNLARVIRQLEELGDLDSHLKTLLPGMETAATTIEEISRKMIDYRDRIEFSQDKLDAVLARLDVINRMKKKYGRDIGEIQAYLQNAQKELKRIETNDKEIENARVGIAALEKTVNLMAEQLSLKRQKAAQSMQKSILQAIDRLGMEKARFEIKITEKPADSDGKDAVEFFISTNPGEEIKPLRKVGSGGEISRMTLGLKTILSEADKIPTIVFDEVDVGIGGRIAEAVGELLLLVSKNHQVICITHLPQISSFANNHILVKKEIKDRSTITRAMKLDDEMRKMEIARMLGGKEITQKVVDHAEEMVKKRKSK